MKQESGNIIQKKIIQKWPLDPVEEVYRIPYKICGKYPKQHRKRLDENLMKAKKMFADSTYIRLTPKTDLDLDFILTLVTPYELFL